MRILLVEDDTTLSMLIETILKQNNYTVDAVFNGRDALAYVEGEIYDAIILDLMLPEVDGITVLKTIRENKNNIPVLILSAKSEVDDKVEGLDAGANDYLTKPFDRKELLARLRVLLRVPSTQIDSTVRVGNISLEETTCILRSPSGEYELVGKEYQILLMFLKNPGTIISAEQIMERIWEFDSDTNLNSVWTYISYIRKKLEALKADVNISTKRNMGYILEKAK